LIEAGTTNNAVNRFWGEVDGKGENTLGKLLMELREDLRKAKKTALNGHVVAKNGRQKRNSGSELAIA